jgi:hypothetical protein
LLVPFAKLSVLVIKLLTRFTKLSVFFRKQPFLVVKLIILSAKPPVLFREPPILPDTLPDLLVQVIQFIDLQALCRKFGVPFS